MRFRATSLALLAAASRTSGAFVSRPSSTDRAVRAAAADAFTATTTSSSISSHRTLRATASATIYSGEPTEAARSSTMDQRQVIRTLPVTSLTGKQVYFDDLIGKPDDNDDKTSIVVFLRSLG